MYQMSLEIFVIPPKKEKKLPKTTRVTSKRKEVPSWLDSNGHKMEQLSIKEDNYHNKLKYVQ